MVVNLLVVGNSETEIFYTERRMLQEEYDIYVQVENRSGCRLEECLPLIQRGMNENTDVIFIWALTSWAWETMSINNGNNTTTVLKPTNSFSLREVPTIMSRITEYVVTVNPTCEIFLVIPGVQDIYSFNQTLLEKAWGSSCKDFLEKHPILNPINMRNHSIYIYQTFEFLMSTEYMWDNKNLFLATHVINLYYSRHSRRRLLRGEKPPHAAYLGKSSLKLNLHLIPDGLHGNQEFLKFFMLRNKKLFKVASNFEKSSQRDSLPAESLHRARTEETSSQPSIMNRFRFPDENYLENLSKKRKVSSSLSRNRPVNSVHTIGAKPEGDILYQFPDLHQLSASSVESLQTQPYNNPNSLPYSISPTIGSQPPTYLEPQPAHNSSGYPRCGQNVCYSSVTVQPRTDSLLTKFPEPLTSNWR